METKKIVLVGRNSICGLLTPKWIVEFYSRKNKNVFIYKEYSNFYVRKDPSTQNDFGKIEYYIVSNLDLGEKASHEQICDLIKAGKASTVYEIFNSIDREDEVLISIAEEINNNEILKIEKIPMDFMYRVREEALGFYEVLEKITS